MALLNARDVFTRRPSCTALWVVRADRIFARTAEEIAADPDLSGLDTAPGVSEAYAVFQKRDHKGVHAYAGEVTASSPAEAMRQALETYPDPKVVVWWVCPSKAITGSSREDADSLFQMSEYRFYREQDEFKTLTALRRFSAQMGDKSPDAS